MPALGNRQEDEMIQQANRTEYGLIAGEFFQEIKKALRVAKAFEPFLSTSSLYKCDCHSLGRRSRAHLVDHIIQFFQLPPFHSGGQYHAWPESPQPSSISEGSLDPRS